MSKLIEKLEKVGQHRPPPLGFGTGARREKAPAILLVGSLSLEQLLANPSLAEAPVDAFLISVDLGSSDYLDKVPGPLDPLVWGACTKAAGVQQVKQLREKGCDFLVFEAENTAAGVLQGHEVGKVLRIDPDLDEGVARALEELPIDAVLLPGSEDLLPLTVQKLITLDSVRGMVDRPFLLSIPAALATQDLEVLRDAAIDALVIDLAAVDGQALQQMRQAIEQLPPRRPRRERPGALVPRIGPDMGGGPSHREEEEEEEEDF